MRNFIITFVISSLLIIQVSWAQVLPQDIDISLSPSDPKPGQVVSATAESFGMDLNSANISWYYNDKLIASGTGKTSIRFTAPVVGAIATLSVMAESQAGTAQSSITIRPGSLDLIWEAIDSYTPPFYKGKALAPIGGRIRVTAIPSANSPKTLSYSWQYDGSAVPSQSGANKNNVNIKTDVLGTTETFGLEANGGAFQGTGTVSVPLRDPDVVIYQKNNGFIDYAHGYTGDIPISTPGVTLRAEPFNFSIVKTLEESLGIDFTLAGQSFTGIDHAQELQITKPDTSGESTLVTSVTSLKERLQLAKRTFTLRF